MANIKQFMDAIGINLKIIEDAGSRYTANYFTKNMQQFFLSN